MYCGGILEYSNNGKSNLFMMKIFKYFRVLRIDILTIQRICYHDVDDTIELETHFGGVIYVQYCTLIRN